MKMLSKVLSKSKSSKDSASDSRNYEQGSLTGRPVGAHGGSQNPQESDLFSFLSSMHLSGSGVTSGSASNGDNIVGSNVNVNASAAAQVYASRKRKFLDGGSASGKLLGATKPSVFLRSTDDDPLHTPQCSQSGYDDDEDSASNSNQDSSLRSRLMLPPDAHHSLIGDIDENLAADFDGSLSGLGVDINSATYSMNEALLALPTLSMFKPEIQSSRMPGTLCNSLAAHSSPIKEEPASNVSSNRGSPSKLDALDLTTDEAATFPESDSSQDHMVGFKSFAGTVSLSRHSTPTTDLSQIYAFGNLVHGSQNGSMHSLNSNLSASQPNLTNIGAVSSHRSNNDVNIQSSTSSLNSFNSRKGSEDHATESSLLEFHTSSMEFPTLKFECVLNAAPSIATKVNEASITYLNQGQSYELILKKLSDLGPAFRKLSLKCVIKICFHERRLQYIEQDQISEWSTKHPGERILDLDLPLCYGISDSVKDPQQLNVVMFKYDPTRETAAHIKVNCISTEFTPKKHGGEKGVPFKLQVEIFDSEDVIIHASCCILQVFKLKGADRKHKQDREKIQKRSPAEQKKFAKQSDKTLLTEIPLENVFANQVSRPDSPKQDVVVNFTCGGSVEILDSRPRCSSREESTATFFSASGGSGTDTSFGSREALHGSSQGLNVDPSPPSASQSINQYPSLTALSSVETVTQWLGRNRYGHLLQNFRNYDGRDLLRLSKDDLVSVCGLSEGIRLYNDLHLTPVAPRMTLYIGTKEGQEFDAIYLEEPTLAELTKSFALTVGVQPSVLCSIYKRIMPQGILIRMTDAVVRNTAPESMFFYTLQSLDDQLGHPDKVDVVLEETNLTGPPSHKISLASCDSNLS